MYRPFIPPALPAFLRCYTYLNTPQHTHTHLNKPHHTTLTSERKARVDDLRGKLHKLQQSATLLEQRTLYERATAFATVKVAKEREAELRDKLEVRAGQEAAEKGRANSWVRVGDARRFFCDLMHACVLCHAALRCAAVLCCATPHTHRSRRLSGSPSLRLRLQRSVLSWTTSGGATMSWWVVVVVCVCFCVTVVGGHTCCVWVCVMDV